MQNHQHQLSQAEEADEMKQRMQRLQTDGSLAKTQREMTAEPQNGNGGHSGVATAHEQPESSNTGGEPAHDAAASEAAASEEAPPEPPKEAKKSVTADDLYRRSSQYQLWSFSSAELDARRRQTHTKGLKLARSKLAAAKHELHANPAPLDANGPGNGPGNGPTLFLLDSPEFDIDKLFDPPTVDEEVDFLNYYCQMMLTTGDFFRMPTQVKASAVSFFKKFYLVNSIVEYHPKLILFTCLFLAAKLENYFMSIDSFTSKLPKTEPKDVLDFEFVVLQSLKFTLYVHHPFRPLYGLFLDTQAILLHPSPLMYDVNVDTLGGLYDRAKKWLVDHAMISDVAFLYTPPQIALAAMYDTDKRITDRYLKRKFGRASAADESASHEYEEIVKTIRRCIKRAKDVEIPSKEKSKDIDKKHFFMQHPDKLLKRKLKQMSTTDHTLNNNQALNNNQTV